MGNSDSSNQNSALDFIIHILKYRKIIILFTLIGTIAAVVVSFLLPKEYLTLASLKTSSSSSGFNLSSLMKSSGVSSGLGALADFALPEGGTQVDYLAAILDSRTVLDSVIKKFHLHKYYGIEKDEDVRIALQDNTVIQKDLESGILYIGVYNKNPETAAAMTNYYVSELNKVFTSLNSQAARNSRENLESRYKDAVNKLTVYEDSLKNFEINKGVYNIKSQTEAAVQATASLKSAIMLKEIQYDIQKSISGENSPQIGMLKSEIDQLNKRYEDMISGPDNVKSDIFIPFQKTPQLGMTYIRLFRNVEIYNELLKVLIPLVENAKIQEQRETPSLVVLDKGIVPKKKSRPKRTTIVLIGFVLSFSLGFLIALMRSNLDSVKNKNPKEYEKIQQIYTTISSDIKFWQKKKS